MIRAMGLDLKPARSGIATNYDPATGEPFLAVSAVGKTLVPLHQQIRILERAVLGRCGGGPTAGGPHVAFIEGTFSRRAGSDYGQHAAHFAATHVLWSLGVPWVDVAPGTLKVWATGSGALRGPDKATKGKVISAVVARYGKTMTIPPVDDECDAVALMSMALAAYGAPLGPDLDVPKERARALRTLTKNGPLPPLRSTTEQEN